MKFKLFMVDVFEVIAKVVGTALILGIGFSPLVILVAFGYAS
jgi:hypothetical protein